MNHTKKKRTLMTTTMLVLAAVLAVMLVVGACAKPAPAPAPKPAPAPAPKPAPAPAPAPKPAPAPAPFKWPERLIIGSSAPGSSHYQMAGVFGAELERTTGMTVRVVPEGGTVLKHRWLRNGILDLVGETMGIARHTECYRQEMRVSDGGPYRNRVMWGGYRSSWGFYVRKNSDIKTVYDIGPETKFSIFPPPSEVTFGLLYGLKLNDGPLAEHPIEGKWKVKIVPFSNYMASIRAVGEYKADVVGSSQTASALLEISGGGVGIRVLQLPVEEDPEFAKRFLELYPMAQFGKSPEEGVKEGWGQWSIQTLGIFLLRADKDEEFVYNLTKWFDETYDTWKDRVPIIGQNTLENFSSILDTTLIPVHPGTVRYLKEKGKWTALDDLRQELNIRLQEGYIRAWDEAMDRASKQKISVKPESKEFAELWSNLKIEMGLPRYSSTLTEEDIRATMALLDKAGL